MALAKAEYHRAALGFVEDPLTSFRRAEEHARKALSIDDRRAHAGAHAILARIYVVVGEHQRGLEAAEQAVQLNPSEPNAYGARAGALLYLGRIDESIANFEIAHRLDPRDALEIGGDLAMAYFMAGRFAEAITTADAHRPRNPFMQVVRIAALSAAGRLDEARREAKTLRETTPFFQVEQNGTRFKNPAHVAKFQQALRGAGL